MDLLCLCVFSFSDYSQCVFSFHNHKHALSVNSYLPGGSFFPTPKPELPQAVPPGLPNQPQASQNHGVSETGKDPQESLCPTPGSPKSNHMSEADILLFALEWGQSSPFWPGRRSWWCFSRGIKSPFLVLLWSKGLISWGIAFYDKAFLLTSSLFPSSQGSFSRGITIVSLPHNRAWCWGWAVKEDAWSKTPRTTMLGQIKRPCIPLLSLKVISRRYIGKQDNKVERKQLFFYKEKDLHAWTAHSTGVCLAPSAVIRKKNYLYLQGKKKKQRPPEEWYQLPFGFIPLAGELLMAEWECWQSPPVAQFLQSVINPTFPNSVPIL